MFLRITSRRVVSMLFILLAAASVAGCGGGNSDPKNESAASRSAEANSPVGAKDHVPGAAVVNNAPEKAALPPVGEGFTKYMEVKSKANDSMSRLVNSVQKGNDPTAGLGLLPMIAADLPILPLTALLALPSKGNGVWEGDLVALFKGTGRIEQKGDISTFKLEVVSKNDPKDKQVITGEYDAKNDSLKALFATNGKETAVFEYTASGKGYVSQLYVEENGKGIVHKSAFDEKNLYAGMLAGNGKPSSIYKKDVEAGESFVKSDEAMVAIQNGKGYAVFGGKKLNVN